MLPDNLRTLPEIDRETSLGNKIQNLASLLGYLLSIVNPIVTSAGSGPVTLGERVKANETLFSDPRDVFFALGVRNYFAHPESVTRTYTEAEKSRAATHLLRAIHEVLGHPAMPRNLLDEIREDRTSRRARSEPDPGQNTRPRPAPSSQTNATRPTSEERYARTSAASFASSPPTRTSPPPTFIANTWPALCAVGFGVAALVAVCVIVGLLIHTPEIINSNRNTRLYVSSNELNLRQAPGASQPKVTKLSRGTEVAPFGEPKAVEGDTWLQVRVGSQTGWVNGKFLSSSPPAVDAPNSTNGPIPANPPPDQTASGDGARPRDFSAAADEARQRDEERNRIEDETRRQREAVERQEADERRQREEAERAEAERVREEQEQIAQQNEEYERRRREAELERAEVERQRKQQVTQTIVNGANDVIERLRRRHHN